MYDYLTNRVLIVAILQLEPWLVNIKPEVKGLKILANI